MTESIAQKKYSSLTMRILVGRDGITVSYLNAFMLPIMIVLLSSLAMLLYQFKLPEPLKWVVVFFLVGLLSGLVAHLTAFSKGEGVLIWRVDRTGFFFPAKRTNILSLKPPLFQAWSTISKVLYVDRYFTWDCEGDRITLKNKILLFRVGAEIPKILEFPDGKQLGFELLKVLRALAPPATVVESLAEYDNSGGK